MINPWQKQLHRNTRRALHHKLYGRSNAFRYENWPSKPHVKILWCFEKIMIIIMRIFGKYFFPLQSNICNLVFSIMNAVKLSRYRSEWLLIKNRPFKSSWLFCSWSYQTVFVAAKQYFSSILKECIVGGVVCSAIIETPLQKGCLRKANNPSPFISGLQSHPGPILIARNPLSTSLGVTGGGQSFLHDLLWLLNLP